MATAAPSPNRSPERRSPARAWALALAGAGAWAIVVPYVAPLAGIRLDVPAGVEVVDHVVPGVALFGAALVLLAQQRRTGEVLPGDLAWSVAAGVAFLAGFWIASTHAPLLAEAADGITAWDAAAVHTSTAVPPLLVGLAMLLRPLVGASSER